MAPPPIGYHEVEGEYQVVEETLTTESDRAGERVETSDVGTRQGTSESAPPAEPASVTEQPSPAADALVWAAGVEEAIARAWSVGSPEAWEEAARIATVMADTARSIAVAIEAQRRANLARDEATEALNDVRGLIQEARWARRRSRNIREVLDEASEENTPTAWRSAVERIEDINSGH